MKKLHTLAFVLLIIGGLNWLLVGLVSGWNLGSYVGEGVARVVYLLVGLSAIYEAATHKKNCSNCVSSNTSSPQM
jgi:uncharacterized protein